MAIDENTCREKQRLAEEEMKDVNHPARILLRSYLFHHPGVDISRHVSWLTDIYEHLSQRGYSIYETSAAIKKELEKRTE